LALTHDGYTFTSVHLTLRKTGSYSDSQNAWAKPSAQLAAEIDQMEANLQLGARQHKGIIDRGFKTPLRQMRKRVNRALGH
jgi:hypothetical protein